MKILQVLVLLLLTTHVASLQYSPTTDEAEVVVPESSPDLSLASFKIGDVNLQSTLMHAIDTNKNGVVESAEFVATGETQEEFNQLDLNGDGVLDADERASALVSSLGSMWVALIRPGCRWVSYSSGARRREAARPSLPSSSRP